MQCPVCKGNMRCKRSLPVGNKVIREYRCSNLICTRMFMSEELAYHITHPKGDELRSELNKAMYERYEKTPSALRKPLSQPKKKRKVAPKPSKRVEGETYLTYSEIFEKFKEQYPDLGINDWRPYPLLDHSIIVWLEPSGLELAYQYWPKMGEFCLIERAKKYKQILEEAERRK